MNKPSILGLAILIPAIALSTSVSAKTVLSAKQRCFQIGESVVGGWNETLKIKPQQALKDNPGAIVESVGLIHGNKAVYPEPNYYDQFAGAASWLPVNDYEVSNVVQIALVGTSYGTKSVGPAAASGLYSINFSLILQPETKGKIPGGRLIGVKTFQAIVAGQGVGQPEITYYDKPVQEISCSDF